MVAEGKVLRPSGGFRSYLAADYLSATTPSCLVDFFPYTTSRSQPQQHHQDIRISASSTIGNIQTQLKHPPLNNMTLSTGGLLSHPLARCPTSLRPTTLGGFSTSAYFGTWISLIGRHAPDGCTPQSEPELFKLHSIANKGNAVTWHKTTSSNYFILRNRFAKNNDAIPASPGRGPG